PLAAIVRDPVYQGQYHTPPEEELRRCGITPLTTTTFTRPVAFLDTSLHRSAEEQQVGNGFINPLECRWVVDACEDYERHLRARDEAPITVSVLCFYRAQAREIRRELGGPAFAHFRKLRF